ncbi:Fatty acid hydroxylase domain-containing protein 2 [Araneus ventricosus]|uniref:Fatty acid hydroxylase domain-containing protein 2 n=1 Tax=Araneus ventricosus TaxID=182803 RepID=A0A4Y2Q0D5_ARAVE|nr:Fatty acid hydroxylase domain-containing protein 2 [Araneus ventricosus]
MNSSIEKELIITKYARHLQRVWEAPSNFFQNLWITIYEWFGCDDYATIVWGSFIIANLAYWIPGICFTLIDLTGRPAFILKYRIQEKSPYPVPFNRVLKALALVVFNQTVVLFLTKVWCYHMMVWRGFENGKTLPTFQRLMLELGFCVIIEEILFYYSHRLLHHSFFYKYIHKRHHEWTSPIGIAALYAHPIEHVICNLLPAFFGPFLLGTHITVFWLWYCLALLTTLNAHTGFHLPLLPSPEAHNFHHLKFTDNYGAMGFLDDLHGTNKNFRNSEIYQRHFWSLSLAPLKQLYPDKQKEE